MRKRGHIRLFVLATAVWAGFWLAGLPSYYQQYSTRSILMFEAALLVAVVVLAWRVLGTAPRERRAGRALWISFYFTVPLAVYDWLYCGVYLGHGLSFLWLYWYLTTFYILPWLVFPGAVLLVNRRGK